MNLLLNGKKITCPEDHLAALKAAYGAGKEITIVNGFATTEDLALKDGDEIYFIPKDRLPPKEALEAMMCSRHTPRVHEKVSAAHVAVCGLGGLGSNAAVYLARTGVGHLHLIDFDTVDASNLNRQSYMVRDLGQRKTDALARQIADINPFIDVRTDFVRMTEDNTPDLLKDDQVICEAFDNPDAKTMLVHTVLEQCPDKYIVSASGMAGYGDSNDIQTKKIMDRFYICGDQTRNAKPGRGLMAPRVAICAAHEANMIIKLLVDVL
ncbi:sulfur carrier protein ThiS adenylyltransferase ThiF [Megasphaera sp.]|uniref:sulfur carrier protein ThiS adenylyltransferase ThiF n=1 Tax=Megasphaera sp. TaxID=2023260 RepID=UPI0025DF3415|nr:sulfur carrier protein ThiS adenylyltransferase ThiF [uncultured Megasphaera sp.]